NSLAAVKISSLPLAGTLKYNGTALTALQVSTGFEVLAANLGLLTFEPAANANGAGYASFTFQVRDDGGTAFGGVDTDQSANTITIDVNSVNDAPSGTDNTVTTNEDTAKTFAAADFGFSDVIDGNSLAAVKISSLPLAGTLKYNGTAITPAQVSTGFEVLAANLGLLTFEPAANANGAGYASFTFQVRDDGGTANGGVDVDPIARAMTLDVTAVNDAPAGANGTVTTLEDTAYVFAAADFGFSDTDGSALAAVRITSVSTAGALTNNGVAVSAGQTVAAADIAAGLLRFTPTAN